MLYNIFMKKISYFSTRNIVLSSLIAALYAGFTVMLAPISYGPIQFRAAEALTLLPYMVPQAIPGLFIGCFIANMLGGYGLVDIILGSAATLAAAWLTSKMPNPWLAAVPPVIINAVAVGGYLAVITDVSVALTMIYIGLSEAVICFGIGVPMLYFLKKSFVLKKYI